MSAALTCWKDIANYLGKGVRTVQRWEHDSGLPVSRPNSRRKSVVFASPEDLDAWISKRSGNWSQGTETEIVRLRAEVARLTAENEVLRHQLLASEQNRSNPASNGHDSTESLWHRCASLLMSNASSRQTLAELTNNSRLLRRTLQQFQLPPIQLDLPPQSRIV